MSNPAVADASAHTQKIGGKPFLQRYRFKGLIKERKWALTSIALWVALLAMSSVACGQGRPDAQSEPKADNVTAQERTTTMKITIGAEVFHATLFDNPTVEAFKAMLPLTLDMEELNGNEKKFDLAKSLPTDASNPKAIESGDLMLWGSRTVVLFYKSFPTSYSYTKLGRIEAPAGLKAAVGEGTVKVTLELDRSPKE